MCESEIICMRKENVGMCESENISVKGAYRCVKGECICVKENVCVLSKG